MSKNLKYTTNSNKFRNFLLASTVLVVIFAGFAIFYEQKFLGTLSWSLLATYISGAILIYLWAIWLVSQLMRDKKLIRIAIDAGIGAVLVIILKNLITPLIENPTLKSWDFFGGWASALCSVSLRSVGLFEKVALNSILSRFL